MKQSAIPVLAKIYSLFKTKKTDDLNVDFHLLHEELPDLDPDQIKAMCGYLEGEGYITVASDPVFPDIRITPSGMKFHESTF